jgi:hypothetical protein
MGEAHQSLSFQRDGGTYSFSAPSMEAEEVTPLPFVISTGEVMGLGPPKVMKNGSCSATTLPEEPPFPPCHPDRSAAEWRDLRFSGSSLEMLFRESEAEWRDLCVDASPGNVFQPTV